MKTSWKFFAALLAGFVLVLGFYAAGFLLNLGVPTESSRWCSEIYEKKRLAAGKITSPKLLLVGGSGTLFGLSAREIQDETGVPTINYGTSAALDTDYLLSQVRRIAKPGDTVLLCLEYELYIHGKLDQASATDIFIDYIVSRDPAYFCSLSPLEKWNVFMTISGQRIKHGLNNRLRPEPQAKTNSFGSVYNLKYINAWGDQMNHPLASRPSSVKISDLQRKLVFGDELPAHAAGFEVIASFCEWARANHIRVLATFPNICRRPEYYLPPSRRTAKTIEDFFATNDVPVLGDYTESILPPDQFFDTLYHLTDEASRLRTQRLLIHLAPYLEKENHQR